MALASRRSGDALKVWPVTLGPPLRHPGLDPGPRFFGAQEEAGPRVEPGVTKEGNVTVLPDRSC